MVDETITMIASYVNAEGTLSLGQWNFNYTTECIDGCYTNPVRSTELDHFPALAVIDYVQLNAITGVFGSLVSLDLHFCYFNFPLHKCSKMVGDILKTEGLLHMHVMFNQCNNDIIIACDGRSVRWYSFNCPDIYGETDVQTNLIGQLDSTQLGDDVTIIDFYFDIFQYKMSAILLSSGEIIILTQTMLLDKLSFTITNRFLERECTINLAM
jgi:hypothetical protein